MRGPGRLTGHVRGKDGRRSYSHSFLLALLLYILLRVLLVASERTEPALFAAIYIRRWLGFASAGAHLLNEVVDVS